MLSTLLISMSTLLRGDWFGVSELAIWLICGRYESNPILNDDANKKRKKIDEYAYIWSFARREVDQPS